MTALRSEVFDFTKPHLNPLAAVFFVNPGGTVDPNNLAGLKIGKYKIHTQSTCEDPAIP